MGDGRRERGRLLAEMEGERIRHVEGAVWFCPSQSEGSGYLVNVETGACSCPDAPRGKCKHAFAVEYRRSTEPAPDAAPVSVARPRVLPVRGTLTADRQANVRRALRWLRTRHGGAIPLAKMLRISRGALDNVACGHLPPSAGLAVRLALIAEVPVDDLIAGRWPPEELCAHCGRGP